MSADTSLPAVSSEAGSEPAPRPSAGKADKFVKSNRAFYVFCGLLFVAAGVMIVNGGRTHPAITEHMGEFGTPVFYRHFAELMQSPHWYSGHAQIMWGPILGCAGALGLAFLVRARGESRWASVAMWALASGTVLWTLVYVFDGFISPKLAPLLLNATPELEPAMNATFGASQWVAITVATPGWILMSVGQLLFGVSLLVSRAGHDGRKLTAFVGGLGVLLGVSTLAAWAAGSFDPGPMISPWWLINAYFGAVWYFTAGVLLLLRRGTPDRVAA